VPALSLDAVLRRRLAKGPISIADFMTLALGHEQHGYYRHRDPLGVRGDFITAPEISQMFGELIGLWCAHVWDLLGRPTPIRLVELGPGRGTLMDDAMRACRKVASSFAAAADIHLVETSPTLRDKQRERLGSYQVAWHDSLAKVPPGPILAIGNEFLDALPIHQLVHVGSGWYERQVMLDPKTGGLSFTVARRRSPLASLLDASLAASPPGSIAELSPATRQLGAALGSRIAQSGGAALFIDYGYDRPAAGDTLQAVKNHQTHAVLADPGEADLTAHVDFTSFAAAAQAQGVRCHGPVPQGLFLRRLGIIERAYGLSQQAEPTARPGIIAGLERLIDEKQMGTLFKVLAVGPASLAPLPGFVL
jgi:NADH dehydrogenase [ubiquinone] 1 alpha subcomplex assembly factor 7